MAHAGSRIPAARRLGGSALGACTHDNQCKWWVVNVEMVYCNLMLVQITFLQGRFGV